MKGFFKTAVVSILTIEARILLKRHRPLIVAITGSVGKTSTKDAIYSALKNQISVRKSEKSYNSEIGVPLTVLGLSNAWNNPLLWMRNLVDGLLTALFSSDYPKVLVLEAGIDRPGDMSRLTSWIQPDIVVLTLLPAVPVHVEYFSTPQAVIEEKMKLVLAMKPEGVLIYNHDDAIITEQLPQVLQRQVGYGRYTSTDINIKNDRIVYRDDQPTGVSFDLIHENVNYTVQQFGTIGMHSAYACSAGVAVAKELGVDVNVAVSALAEQEPLPGRLRLVPGIKGTLLLDDTYNASPVAVEHALMTLREVVYAKRKIVVLGDMLELGKYSSEAHKKIGTLVPDVADFLITVGVRARLIAEASLASGMSEKNILQYEDVTKAGRELQALLQTGDVVLVKASQGIRAERIIEEVMSDPDTAPAVLVRQDRAWQKIKV
jgi:UDP-N-acetylmuramoyl-tripeptide--D-alanyl-D-alanine ligase